MSGACPPCQCLSQSRKQHNAFCAKRYVSVWAGYDYLLTGNLGNHISAYAITAYIAIIRLHRTIQINLPDTSYCSPAYCLNFFAVKCVNRDSIG